MKKKASKKTEAQAKAMKRICDRDRDLLDELHSAAYLEQQAAFGLGADFGGVSCVKQAERNYRKAAKRLEAITAKVDAYLAAKNVA